MTGDRNDWAPEPGRVYHEYVGSISEMEVRLPQLREHGWAVVKTENVSNAYLYRDGMSVTAPGIRIDYQLAEVSHG